MKPVLCTLAAEQLQQDRREAWEAYTANTLCVIASALGSKQPLYTTLLEQAEATNAKPADDRTGAQIAMDVLGLLGG